jgi:hypothetical protein
MRWHKRLFSFGFSRHGKAGSRLCGPSSSAPLLRVKAAPATSSACDVNALGKRARATKATSPGHRIRRIHAANLL